MDAAKCEGNNCPLKDKCFRYLAPEDPWRDCGDFVYDDILDRCIDFWPIEGGIQNDIK
jgi:hypothetical protein